MRRSYGLIPDKEDMRDYLVAAPLASTILPVSVDLRDSCSPVRDQGDLGSCTGFAIAVGLREFMLKKAGKRQVQLSPMFLYYQERLLEGSIEEDAGAELRDGMKVLVKNGVCTEADDKYSLKAFKKAPSIRAVSNARDYEIISYHRLTGLKAMKSTLAAGMGLVIGFTVYDSFESNATAATGYMSMPTLEEDILGGHAVFVCGYRNDIKAPGGGWLIIKNSWGAGWGEGGYFYMPYAYVTRDLVNDCWTAVV